PQYPNSVDAEQSLLGSLIVYPDSIFKAYEKNLQAEDFYLDKHRKIYRTINDLNDEKMPVDITSVITRLTDTKLINLVGGPEYITEIADMPFSSQNVDFYIDTIRQKALLRKLIDTSSSIIDDAQNNSADFDDILAQAENSILGVTRQGAKTGNVLNSQQAMNAVMEQLKNLQNTQGMTGVPSGYRLLDRYTNGFQKGDLIILAARTAVGKTAFALNLALNAAVMHKKSVAIFSLEMPTVQLAMRMLSAEAMVNGMSIRTGKNLSDSDYGRINNAARKISEANLFFDESSDIKVNEIAAKCRKLKEDGHLDLIIIDYLQLITPTHHSESRQQEVSEISRNLKALAREMNVPVIALSQLSRLVEQRGRKDNRPLLSDLRESGSIEQDADMVLFLYRINQSENDENEEENEQTSDAHYFIGVIIGKHRNGQTGEITLVFQPNLNSFFNKEYES
ncbi:MAG: replicative DNA helicase, partial [Erysipelotrichaceae bacterium]|nr:replicative DNA helicase [Erysipelotrichaceae bacterium]